MEDEIIESEEEGLEQEELELLDNIRNGLDEEEF